jgi:tubulin polyglutamylase TTLL5
MLYENPIDSIKDGIFPNIEDVYDMETENLVLVKEKIEEKFNFDENNLNLSDGEDDVDLNFCSVTSIEISVYKERKLKKLYKFVLSELKERNYFEEVLNFFMDKNSFQKITDELFNEKILPISESRNIDSEKKIKLEEITNYKDSSHIYSLTTNNYSNSFISRDSKQEKNEFIFEPVKRVKTDIRSLLQKTKVEDGFKKLAEISNSIRNIKTVQIDRKLPLEDHKQLIPIIRNKQSNRELPPTIIENKISNTKVHAPIKINYNINVSINVKSKKKKKKITTLEEEISKQRSKSNLEMRRNYVVPDIKAFIKEKPVVNTNFDSQSNDKNKLIKVPKTEEQHFNQKNNSIAASNISAISNKASIVYNTRIDIEVKDKNCENKVSIKLENSSNNQISSINLSNQNINIEVKDQSRKSISENAEKLRDNLTFENSENLKQSIEIRPFQKLSEENCISSIQNFKKENEDRDRQDQFIEDKSSNHLQEKEKLNENSCKNTISNQTCKSNNEFKIVPSKADDFSINKNSSSKLIGQYSNEYENQINEIEDESDEDFENENMSFEEMSEYTERENNILPSESDKSTHIENSNYDKYLSRHLTHKNEIISETNKNSNNSKSLISTTKRIQSFATLQTSVKQSCQEVDEETSDSEQNQSVQKNKKPSMSHLPLENLISEQNSNSKEKVDFEKLKNLISGEEAKKYLEENSENYYTPNAPCKTRGLISHNIPNIKNSVLNNLTKTNFNTTRETFSRESFKNNHFNKTSSSSNNHFPLIKNKHTFSTGLNFYPQSNPNFNKDRKKSALAQLKERSQSSKLALLKHIKGSPNSLSKLKAENLNYQNIPDYSHIYKNFVEIFNGYFLSSDISTKQFDMAGAMSSLYTAFKALNNYENTQTGQIEKFERLNSNILQAEAEVIKNRLKQVSDKLLTDQDNLDGERYYVFKKILELQKKEYGRRKDKINYGETGEEHDLDNVNTNSKKMYFRVVLSRPEIYDIMCYTLGLREEWGELPHGMLLGQSWNLMWTYSVPNLDWGKIFSFQKVNHLINNRIFSRKDLLKKALDRIRKMNQKINKLFDIMPTTFILSKEYVDFVDEFTRSKNSGINPAHNLWIVKPVGKSRGRGIFIINDISEVPVAESHLVQRYLTNPLLIDGYKFDMRIYVLVTSVNPLEAFLYRDGFARVSNMPFSLNNNDRMVHLTNASVQNKVAYNRRNQNYEKMYGGSKISLEMLKNKLIYKGINFDTIIWKQVKEIILKSLVAGQHEVPYSPAAFELFGYDIIIDQNLDCWLLEINSSPSLERSNVLDDQIKLQLVEDVLNIVDPINFDRKALIEVMERRLNINQHQGNNVYLYSPTIQLNLDLNQIFRGKVPRAYGEIPKNLGNFERIAPSEESDRLIKMTGGQKMYGNKKPQ